MTVSYTADVHCDRCGNWVHGAVSNVNKHLARDAVASAKRKGWSRDTKSSRLDLCPDCLQRERKST